MYGDAVVRRGERKITASSGNGISTPYPDVWPVPCPGEHGGAWHWYPQHRVEGLPVRSGERQYQPAWPCPCASGQSVSAEASFPASTT